MSEKLYKIGISVTGVKKRCRKSDRHYLPMGYIPYNEGQIDQAEIEARAKDFVAENMKSVVGNFKVCLNFIERKKDDYGTIETWEMFGNENKSFTVQTSLEKELV
jgi:hypothetical protein